MKREDTITIQPLKGTKRKQIKMQGPNLITVEVHMRRSRVPSTFFLIEGLKLNNKKWN